MVLEIEDCYHSIRHQILPRNCGLTFILRQNFKFSYFFARNFECTWRALFPTKFSNMTYTCSPRACKEFLKFSDQLDVRSLCNRNSKFQDFSLKNGKLDDVTKWSWRHQKNFIHSLSQPPIDYLSDLGSNIAVSFPCLEIY